MGWMTRYFVKCENCNYEKAEDRLRTGLDERQIYCPKCGFTIEFELEQQWIRGETKFGEIIDGQNNPDVI